MQPQQHHADDVELLDIWKLIRASFAYMDGRIDPPSSMYRLTLADIAQACRSGEVWSIGEPVHACMMLNLKPQILYLGKLAISEKWRNQGIGKQLIEHAILRAQHHKKTCLEVYVRIELTKNLAYFESLEFNIIEKKAHTGYSRPTYVVMHRAVPLSEQHPE